jgi:energy-coupling factor transport system permease protein
MSMATAMPTSFIPGQSMVHRIHPVTKIVWIIVYVALAFTTQNIFILYSVALLAIVLAIVSGVFRPLLKAAYLIIPIGSSLISLQVLAPATERPWTPIAEIGIVTLYGDGLYYALVLLGRIVSSMLLALVMVMTTHPSDLFLAFSKLKIPYTFNFMLAMTLQLIPVFQREVGIVLSAQKSRGMKGSGFSSVLPSFVPVFVGAIERVQQLSISLESRGFGSSGEKTSYRRVVARVQDWVYGIVGALAMIGLMVYSILQPRWWNLSDIVVFEPQTVLVTFTISVTIFFSVIVGAAFLSFRKT